MIILRNVLIILLIILLIETVILINKRNNIINKINNYKIATNNLNQIYSGFSYLINDEDSFNFRDLEKFWSVMKLQELKPKREPLLDIEMIKRLRAPYEQQIQVLLTQYGFNIEKIFINEKGFLCLGKTDQVLKIKGYQWIVYIKLLNRRPFIVDKTGVSGSLNNQMEIKSAPVNFDFLIGNKDDQNRNTPGRNFVKEYFPNKTTCDYDFILCKNFNNEQEALNYKQFIAKKFNLYQS